MRAAVTLVGLLALLTATGCSKATEQVSGLVLVDVDFYGLGDITSPQAGKPCTPESIQDGSKVTVRDSEGAIIATGIVTADDGEITEFVDATGFDCAVPYEVGDLPSEDFYSFEVQGLTEAWDFSKGELESAGWRVDLQQNLPDG